MYDVTVGYPVNVVSSEFELLKTGRFPEEVHFDVKRYNLNELYDSDDTDLSKPVDASKWLLELWKNKEARLKTFYETTKHFEPSGSGFVWPVSVSTPFNCCIRFRSRTSQLLITRRFSFGSYLRCFGRGCFVSVSMSRSTSFYQLHFSYGYSKPKVVSSC